MLIVTVKADFKPFKALLGGLQKQVPFALASALTQTAKDAQAALEHDIARVFDRPVPFTLKGVGITWADKRQPVIHSSVFLKRKQTAYLEAQVQGGERRRKPFEAQFGTELSESIKAALPGQGAKLNASGNLTRAEIARLGRLVKRKGSKVFAAKAGGHLLPGIYERTRRGLKPLLMFEAQPAKYRKRFDFYGIAQRTAERKFQLNFDRAWARAVATAH